jgi:hypothetical protein
MELADLVTCFVGKNESGKTAVLEAVYRLNPLPIAHPQEFNGLRDYPRRTYNRDRASVPSTTPTDAIFQLEPADVQVVETKFGKDVLKSNSITVQKNYENKRTWSIDYNDRKLVRNLLVEAGLDPNIADGVSSIQDLIVKLKG